MPTTNPLFTDADLNALPGVGRVTADEAAMVERIVWGWLKPVLGLSERPATVPDEVFSWAIELGAIARENPAGLSSEQLGSSQRAFSAERRSEILQSASAHGSTTAGLTPRGCFPPALAYPDGAW